jgi:tripartite-type tricarboxylate transporter receptor subunit TctC
LRQRDLRLRRAIRPGRSRSSFPFAPGGSASTAARSVADKMSETLGQQIVIDNRGGAGGTVATRAVAKSPPDGYTLLVITSATVGTSPSLFQNLGYDPRKDFAPIGLIAATPNLIAVHPSFPARSLADLIKIGKRPRRRFHMARPAPARSTTSRSSSSPTGPA